MLHVHLVSFIERNMNESTEQWFLNRRNVLVRMRAKHKIVGTTSDKAEYRLVEGRIIGTVLYFNYGNFVLGICKNSPFLHRVY